MSSRCCVLVHLQTHRYLDCPDARHCVYIAAGLSQEELVATLRSRARKSAAQSSNYRGVSLLKQTGKWHAQINVGGRQVGLSCLIKVLVIVTACCAQCSMLVMILARATSSESQERTRQLT